MLILNINYVLNIIIMYLISWGVGGGGYCKREFACQTQYVHWFYVLINWIIVKPFLFCTYLLFMF